MTLLKQLEHVWEFYSFITRNRIFDFKFMQYFMKKINAWAYVAYYLFLWYPHAMSFLIFFLTFWLWKLLIYMLFMRGFVFQLLQNYYITPFYIYIYIYMYIIYEYISSLMKIHALKKTCKYNLNLHLPCYVPPQVSRDFSFPKRATKIAFHGGDFWGKFMGRGTWRG